VNTLNTLTAAATLFFAANVSAFVILVPATGPDTPPGYASNKLIWAGDSDWAGSSLVIDLTAGSVYNHGLGGDSAPSSAMIASNLGLQYETYVGIIDDTTAGITGGATDAGGGPLSLDAPQISVSWFNTRPNDIGPVQIGMLTLSEDASGIITTFTERGSLVVGVFDNWGDIMPEPATLALLALAGPVLLRRRIATQTG